MRFSSLSQLAPEVACRRLEGADLEEKNRLAEGLALIALVDSRRDFLAAGCSSMHAYCTGRLRWSGERAFRRIAAARLGARVPLLFEYIADGRLTLTNACELAAVLTPDNAAEVLAAVEHKSKHAERQLVHERRNTASASTPAAVPLAPAQAESHVESLPAPAPSAPASSHAPAHGTPAKRGRVVPNLTGGADVSLALTAEEHALLAQAQDLLAHVVRDGDPAVVVARALAHDVEHLKKKRFGAGPASATAQRAPRGRHVPLALRRHVAERDGHRCTFAGPDGHRCACRRALQFDHVVPIAEGGTTSAENLRLLCPAHNRFEADRLLGKDRIVAIRERRDRARALAAAAKEREEKREEQRAAEGPTPTEVVIAALESLGFKHREARHAAGLSEGQPGISVEQRVKLALRQLSSSVIARSERWALATSWFCPRSRPGASRPLRPSRARSIRGPAAGLRDSRSQGRRSEARRQ